MARKKVEPVETLGKDVDKLTVQKSKPLFALWRSALTLSEFKILDTYLAKINSHNPEKRGVVFEKGELEKLLGVQKINNADLKMRLKHLLGNVLEIPNIDGNGGFSLITLFEEAVAEQDEYGLWKVKLECTQKAMQYIFNIENLGYCRYKLRCVTSITSRYTYIMFIYLESLRKIKSWTVSLEELKKILACDKEELYKEYKFFNQKILKRVQSEMNEKTECRYTYEPIKKGRSVVAIRFTLETLPKVSCAEEQLTIDQLPSDFSTEKELWEDALADFYFSKKQLEEIRTVLVCVPTAKLPPDTTSYSNDIDIRWYHYLTIKTAEIRRRENTVKNTFAYLLKMLKQDAGIE